MYVFKERVLLVHNYYQQPGGEDVVLRNEQRLLEEKGHFVRLYTRHNDEIHQFSSWQTFCALFASVFSLKTYRDVRRLIRENAIDLVHVHNTLPLISPSVYWAAHSMQVPVVQTVHNYRLLCPNGLFFRDGHICEDCAEKSLFCAIGHRCYRGSLAQTVALVLSMQLHRLAGTYSIPTYIALTRFGRKKLLQLQQIQRERVFVKPHFYAPSDALPAPVRKRTRQFVFVGRLDATKGIRMLLEAWAIAALKDFSLVVVGKGPEDEWCADYVKQQGLTNVKLVGALSHTLALQTVARSACLVFPSIWHEGFGLTQMESIALGTPVLVSDTANLREVLTCMGGEHLFCPATAEGFAQGISLMATHITAERQSDDTAASQTLNESCLPEKNYQMLSDIYAYARRHISGKGRALGNAR
ncbi:MAG: glycosyltransferase family 4 protein [Oscillospiraceae bacterium]|nr:glycosyltransferase family 4 protein [Oscillospiraceae bacterium]